MRDRSNLVRCLITLTDKQKDSFDLLARNICRKRVLHKKNIKISTSTLIRCLVEILMENWNELDLENIKTEAELLERIKKLFNYLC